MITHGSLFTGVGGFDLGFERAGIKTIWQVEINEYCTKVLDKRFQRAEWCGDVREFGTNSVDSADIITGGDPCQENSNARRTADTTSPSLGAEFIRIVAEFRPRIVVRENPATVRKDAPWPWWRFRAELERLGYSVLPFRLRACCVGADFRRDRLFLLAEISGSERARLEGDECEVLARADDGRHNANIARPDRWSATPRICGSTPRIPHRVDRLRALGNSVCPAVAEWVGRRIVEASK